MRYAGFGFVYFGHGCFANFVEAFDTFILLFAQPYLLLCHLVEFFIEKHLQKRRSNLNTDVLFRLVQVFHGCFQIQFVQCNGIGYLHPGEKGDIRTDIEGGVFGISVGIDVLTVQGTPEIERL